MLSSNKIIFTFNNGKESLVLDDTLYSVSDYEGLDASEYELTTTSNITTDGATLKRKRVLPREIIIEFDYLKNDYKAETRQKLIRFFTPYRTGTLAVNYMGFYRTIEYEVSAFKISSTNIYEPISAQVTLSCMDPNFKAEETAVPIVTLIGGWKWKFKLPFKLKQYGELEKIIYNSGDTSTPIEIYFKGPAVSPTVYLDDTGEYIRVQKDLAAGETLYINTGFRKKTVQIISDTGTEDAWDYLDMTSTFFWLQQGDNKISYSHTGTERSTGVEIKYNERFLGV